MYEGCKVDLQMQRMISADGIFDETTRYFKIKRYEANDDFMTLLAKDSDLTVLSLDAKYQCYIHTGTEKLNCSGVIRERFQSEDGNVVIFRIENGFYSA